MNMVTIFSKILKCTSVGQYRIWERHGFPSYVTTHKKRNIRNLHFLQQTNTGDPSALQLSWITISWCYLANLGKSFTWMHYNQKTPIAFHSFFLLPLLKLLKFSEVSPDNHVKCMLFESYAESSSKQAGVRVEVNAYPVCVQLVRSAFLLHQWPDCAFSSWRNRGCQLKGVGVACSSWAAVTKGRQGNFPWMNPGLMIGKGWPQKHAWKG